MGGVRVGDLLAGKYRVERVLGVGGMGVVVAARHVELGELRAIKLLLPQFRERSEAVERFVREARAAVRLKSEHAAQVHDVGRLEGGAPYMVMEYLEGSDLGALLKARGPLPIHEAATHVLQALDAVAEAHAAGIVHRDLKPANLFLATTNGGPPIVKVLDFGISKVLGEGLDLTNTSALLGSPLYMSPEQMRASRNVDVRTDVWSLGVILYHLVTGTVPFHGETVTQLCLIVVQDEPLRPSAHRPIPLDFETIIMRCLEKDPARRFQNVAELAIALAPFWAAEKPPPLPRILRLLGVSPQPAAMPQSLPPPPMILGNGASTISPAVSNTAASWGTTGTPARPKSHRGLIIIAAIAATGLGGVAAWVIATRRPSVPSAVAAEPSTSPVSSAALPLPVTSASEAPPRSAPTAQSTEPVEPSAPTPAPQIKGPTRPAPAAPVKPSNPVHQID